MLMTIQTNGWHVTKEKVLFFAGLTLLAFLVINAEVFGNPFHIEFLLAALALLGVSITQWGDKR